MSVTIPVSSMPDPGDYFCTATSGIWYDRLFAWVIRFVTASKVNHAGLYVGPTDDYPEGAIIEAAGKVRYNSVYAYRDAIWSTGRLPSALTPTPTQRTAIVAAAVAMIGNGYNWVDLPLIGFAQRRLGGWLKGRGWFARRISNDGREICSQVIDVCYNAAGIQLFLKRLPGLVSPGDLDNLLLPVGVG